MCPFKVTISLTVWSKSEKLVAIEMSIACWRCSCPTLLKARVRIAKSSTHKKTTFQHVLRNYANISSLMGSGTSILSKNLSSNVPNTIGTCGLNTISSESLNSSEVELKQSISFRGVSELYNKDLPDEMLGSTSSMHGASEAATPQIRNILDIASGLRNRDGSSEDSRNAYLNLALMIRGCDEQFNPDNVFDLLGSLGGVKSDSFELEAVLSALTTQMNTDYEEPLSIRGIEKTFDVLEGLQKATSFLQIMVFMLRNSFRSFTYDEANHTFAKIYCLNCVHEDVRELFGELVSKLQRLYQPRLSDVRAAEIPEILITKDRSSAHWLSALEYRYDNWNVTSDADNVVSALSCMYKIGGDTSTHELILRLLRPKIVNFSAANIGDALHGLHPIFGYYMFEIILPALAHEIKSCTEVIGASEISRWLHSLQERSCHQSQNIPLISALTFQLERCTEAFDAQNVAASLCGLRSTKCETPEVRLLISTLTHKVKSCESGLDGNNVFMTLCGLEAMSSEEAEVKRLLSAVTPLVQRCKESISPVNVIDCFKGLSKMNKSDPEVGALLAALSPRVIESLRVLDSSTLTRVKVQLQDMKGKGAEGADLINIMEEILHAGPKGISHLLKSFGNKSSRNRTNPSLILISQRIEGCKQHFSAREVVDCLTALRGYRDGAKDFEVLYFLSTMTRRVLACKEEMTARDMSKALNTMRYLNTDSTEVKGLLSALSHRVRTSSAHWTGSDICGAIVGLNSMDCSSNEINQIFLDLGKKLETCEDVLTNGNIGASFFGLNHKKSIFPAICKLATALGSRIESSIGTFTNEDLTRCFKGITLFDNSFVERNGFLPKITAKLVSSTERIDASCLTAAFISLKSRSNARPEVRNLLLALSKRIELINTPLQCREVSGILFGMQSMDSNDSSLRAVLAVLAPRIVQSPNEFSARDIGMSLYGMQGMDSVSSEVREVLVALLPKIQKVEALDNQSIGNALYGLKNMTADYHEVAAVVSALAKGISSVECVLTPQNIGNALYGLKSMTSDFVEVREVVAALAIKVTSCKGTFKPQEIGNSLYGLQGMSSDHVEVRDLLTSLAPKIQDSRDLSAQEISNALYGLRAMSSDHPEVRLVVAALKDRIEECTDDFTAQHLCSSFYGLQRMSGDSPEVRQVLSALLPKFEQCEGVFGGLGIGNILFGLRACRESPEAQLVLDELFHRVSLLEVKTKEFKELDTVELRSLCQRMVLFLSAIEGKVQLCDKKWQELSWTLSSTLSGRPHVGSERGPSQAERRLYAAVTKALENSSMIVSSGNNLMNLFEGDIVIQIPVTNQKEESLIFNIEVDGTCHQDERRRVFNNARDAYLRTGGIVVERLEVATMNKMDDSERTDWIMEKIANAVLTHSMA